MTDASKLIMIVVAAAVAATLVHLDARKSQSAHAKTPAACVYTGQVLPVMPSTRVPPMERRA
jgi:hypothetical protein